jgi:uncharacterized protein (UPF0335 family)
MTNSKLSEIAAQIIALESQKDDIALEIKAAKDAAKHYGYSAPALTAAIKLARMTPEQREKHDTRQMDIEAYLAEIEGRSMREAAE